MRKAITRGVLTVAAVLFLASRVSAAPIAIGELAWLQTGPGGGQFSVIGQAGLSWLGDPAFPVVDPLTVNNFNLVIVAPGPCSVLGADLGDGITRDSVAPCAVTPMLATLTGNVNELQVMVDLDGILGPNPAALWNINNGGAITNILGLPVTLGSGTAPLANNITTLLYIDATPVATAVPEPATMFLLGSGAVGLIARRRKAARKA